MLQRRNHNEDCRFDGFINLLFLTVTFTYGCARGLRLRLYYINNSRCHQFSRIRTRVKFILRDILVDKHTYVSRRLPMPFNQPHCIFYIILPSISKSWTSIDHFYVTCMDLTEQ